MRGLAVMASAVLAASAGGAAAHVVAASAGGLEVTDAVDVAAPPATLWQTLVAPATWWSSAHSWSGDAGNLSLDPRAGGCFCERLPKGGGVEHMRVVQIAPDRLLRLSGALGPMQGEGVVGTLTFEIAPVPAGASRVTMRYVVGGFRAKGLESFAAPVDQVLSEQLGRLKAVAEGRRPAD